MAGFTIFNSSKRGEGVLGKLQINKVHWSFKAGQNRKTDFLGSKLLAEYE